MMSIWPERRLSFNFWPAFLQMNQQALLMAAFLLPNQTRWPRSLALWPSLAEDVHLRIFAFLGPTVDDWNWEFPNSITFMVCVCFQWCGALWDWAAASYFHRTAIRLYCEIARTRRAAFRRAAAAQREVDRRYLRFVRHAMGARGAEDLMPLRGAALRARDAFDQIGGYLPFELYWNIDDVVGDVEIENNVSENDQSSAEE